MVTEAKITANAETTNSLSLSEAIQQAIDYHKAGKLQDAERLYRAIIQKQPNHPDANHNLGVIAVQVKQTVASLPHFKAALEANSNQKQYWLSYIDALIQTGQTDMARQVLIQGQQRGLQGVELKEFAERLEKSGQLHTQAIADNQQVQPKQPVVPTARQSGKKIQKTKNVDKSAKKGKTPSQQEINALAALFLKEQYAEVAAHAQSMTARFPFHPFGWKALGTAFFQLGRNEEALTAMKKAVLLLPGEAEAHNNLANVFKNLGRLGESESSYLRALKINPNYAQAHFNLGCTLESLDRQDEAVASYQRALQLKPDFVEVHINLGGILQKQEALAEAEVIYRHALQINPNSFEAFGNLAGVLWKVGRLNEAEEYYRRLLEIKSDHVTGDINPAVIALLPFGRSGSLFLHSLFDGHPEIATLPGVYFKGWFDIGMWTGLAPNINSLDWREHLVERILIEYQSFFDASCKKNVPGKPMKSDWLAKDMGFVGMGPDRSKYFVIDKNAFSKVFLSLLAPLSSINAKDCFELIHRAFEIAIRGNTASGAQEDGHIFYHIHNPGFAEIVHFMQCYPQAQLLTIMRNPVQSMESWILTVITEKSVIASLVKDTDASTRKKTELDARVRCWSDVVELIATMFDNLQSPFNKLIHSRGVRLEDIKRDPQRVMPQIAAWMGVSNHPSLYDSSFCGLQYWGPVSRTGNITGFDTKAIDQPVERFLGQRDILIFETLFWPLSHLYGYTDLDEVGFRKQLAEIRPWLDEPLEFEAKLYAELPEHTQLLDDLPPYKRLHRFLHRCWAILDKDGTYHGMVQPLELI